MATNPMQQFEVHRIGPSLSFNGVDLSFTNSSLFMLISSILIIIFFVAGTRRVNIVPSKIQLLNELVFNFISKMINETVGPNARPYFPFILTIFLFILTLNMQSLRNTTVYSTFPRITLATHLLTFLLITTLIWGISREKIRIVYSIKKQTMIMTISIVAILVGIGFKTMF